MNRTTTKRTRGWVLALPMALLLPAESLGRDAPQAISPSTRTEFFGLDKIWKVDITVDDAAWSSMRPTKRGYGRNRFPYVHARVRIAGLDEMSVGLRFKGQSTFWNMPGGHPKRSFKLDFGRKVAGQQFLGLSKLNLNNNHFDATQVREAISYQAYRDALVPAASTAFARVYLTVENSTAKQPPNGDGETTAEFLGLYTIVEQQDVDFLKRHTGEKGVLLKPEKLVLPYFGDQWNDRYAEYYQPRTDISPLARQVVIDLAQLQHDYRTGWIRNDESRDDTTRENNQQDFRTRLERVLEVDEFLRYLAVTILIGNGDSPLLMHPHNYYLAIPNQPGRILWLPWDLNASIGGMGKFQGARLEELSIYQPSNVPLVERVLEIPTYRERYTMIMRELVEGRCSANELIANYEIAKTTTAGAIAKEAADRPGIKGYFDVAGTDAYDEPAGKKRKDRKKRGRAVDLAQFFRAREMSVLDQLAGRSQGVRPTRGGKSSEKMTEKQK